MHLTISSAKSRPFCSGIVELIGFSIFPAICIILQLKERNNIDAVNDNVYKKNWVQSAFVLWVSPISCCLARRGRTCILRDTLIWNVQLCAIKLYHRFNEYIVCLYCFTFFKLGAAEACAFAVLEIWIFSLEIMHLKKSFAKCVFLIPQHV